MEFFIIFGVFNTIRIDLGYFWWNEIRMSDILWIYLFAILILVLILILKTCLDSVLKLLGRDAICSNNDFCALIHDFFTLLNFFKIFWMKFIFFRIRVWFLQQSEGLWLFNPAKIVDTAAVDCHFVELSLFDEERSNVVLLFVCCFFKLQRFCQKKIFKPISHLLYNVLLSSFL